MEDDDRPTPSGERARHGVAGLLAGESLDSYSRDELDARVTLLEAEIARVKAHRDKAEAHRLAAEAVFKAKPA